jgi:hypothetical protein
MFSFSILNSDEKPGSLSNNELREGRSNDQIKEESYLGQERSRKGEFIKGIVLLFSGASILN